MSSRLFAASDGWPMPLPLWMRIRGLAAITSIAGIEPEWPWGNASNVTEDDKAAAEASLRERWS